MSDSLVGAPGDVVTDIRPSFTVDDYRVELALTTAGVKACAERYPQGGSPGEAAEVSVAFAARALRDAGHSGEGVFGAPGALGAAGSRVNAFSPQRFRDVAATHAGALGTCSMTITQIP